MNFLQEMAQNYSEIEKMGAEKILIGYSTLGREIFAFAVGCGRPKIIVQYAIHAREYITYFLAIKQIKDAIGTIKVGQGTVYFVPVVNIDGVALCIDGLNSVPVKYHLMLKNLVKNEDFSLFKANILGVDLNVNFDARWGTRKNNVRVPSSANFIGIAPESEAEVKALVNFTRKIKPNMTISYHSKGEVIYYDFHQPRKIKKNHKKIAENISKSTGYAIQPSGKSAGGYKDWCIEKLGIPAVTIEVGEDTLIHPITKRYLPSIYQKNAKVIHNLLDYLRVILYNTK